MPAQMKWEDNFWGEGSKGFPVLCDRLEQGQASIKEFTDFFAARAKAEQDYANELQRLVKTGPFRADQGSLRRVLDKTITTSDIIVKLHAQQSQMITSAIEDQLNKFKSSQRRSKKEHELEMERAAKFLKQETAVLEKAKKDYTTKCNDMAKAIQIAGRGQTGSMTKKEYEKIQEKAIKAKKDADTAEADYKSAVQRLNQAQDVWDEKMISSAKEFQKLEEERLRLTKSTFEKIIDSQIQLLINSQKEIYEALRKEVDTIDIGADLDFYCNQLKTGESKSERVQFQPFFGQPSVEKKASLAQLRSNSNILSNSSDPKISTMNSIEGRAPILPSTEEAATAALVRLKTKIRSKNNLNQSTSSLQHRSAENLENLARKSSTTEQDTQNLDKDHVSGSSEIKSEAKTDGPVNESTEKIDKQYDSPVPAEAVPETPADSTDFAEATVTHAAISDQDLPIEVVGVPSVQTTEVEENNPDHTHFIVSESEPEAKAEEINEKSTEEAHGDPVEQPKDFDIAAQIGKISLNTESKIETVASPDSGMAFSPRTDILNSYDFETQERKVESVSKNQDATKEDSIEQTEKVEEKTDVGKIENPEVNTELKVGSLEDLPKKSFARKSIKMEGWVNIFETGQQWNKQWCVLEGGYIWVYENMEEAAKPHGVAKPKAMLSLSKGVFTKGLDDSWNLKLPSASEDNMDNLFSLLIGGKRQVLFSVPVRDDWTYWTVAIDGLMNKKK